MIVYAQTTSIPDPNFEQALINLGHDTGTPNGSVPTANINTVDELFISNQNISDLTGIEAFVALEYLYCDNNNLSLLDLSFNTLLDEIDCSSNNITTLTLAHNSVIEELICSNNQISTLDLSNQPELKWLECENNQLVDLNLRNGNSFYSILAANNPTLTCIEVDDANESYSDWTGSNYSFDSQHYFHGIQNADWIDVGVFNPPTFNDGARGFIIDDNDIMYVIEGNTHAIYKYDGNISNNWIEIGDSAHAIAVDQNNKLYKIYLERYFNNPAQPDYYEITKIALKIMSYDGSSWYENSVDTIFSDYIPSNFNWYGVTKIEDFLIDSNNEAYVSLMKNDYAFDLFYDFSPIIVRKYDINSDTWLDLPDTEIVKEHYNYFGSSASFALSWWSTRNLNTDLDINPVTGRVMIAGQQVSYTNTSSGWYDPVFLTGNVIKEYDGNSWNLLGNPLPFGGLSGHNSGGSFLATNNNGDLFCAFTNDKGEFGQPYEDDTLMIYKYNYTSMNWDALLGGNPDIDMYYVNSLSIDINSIGEPIIAFESQTYPPYIAVAQGMKMVLKYDSVSHLWETIASPIGSASGLTMMTTWYCPIIKLNNDDDVFVNYLKNIGANIITFQNMDSTLCSSILSVPQINNSSQHNKSLIKIMDILGRQTRGETNQPLFYIYDDGTVEKRIVID